MSALAELQARQMVQRMHRLTAEVDAFASHARMLRQSAKSFDGLVLLREGDNLLRALQASTGDFRDITAHIKSVSRALPSRPQGGVGLRPAAQWGNELRAGSGQFVKALLTAESEIGQLRGAASEQLSSPTRNATAPDNLLDVALTFLDALARWIEYRRRTI
jgi:hypothetical protein